MGVHHAPRRTGGRFGARLYLRIWLALVASLMLAALLAGAAWRFYSAEIPREITLTDEQGGSAGHARLEFRQTPGAVRVEMDDGRVLFAHWSGMNGRHRPFNFLGMLLFIVGAVGAAAYPVVRRLTRRLEQLQEGLDALGEGRLEARVQVRGHDEIARLAARFNLAAARIEVLVGAHKNLLANASHELRSPLARIRMGLEMLDRANGDGAGPARDEIVRNIVELDELIEEILLASRLDARDAPDEVLEEVDLTALTAEECSRVGADFDAHGVITLIGSPRLLRRALRNLLENARRHGGNERPIDVSLRRPGTMIELAVCDRGPGVPELERDRIFEPFYRLQGTSESGGGTGLGLALVSAIAKKHGGTARCEERAGGGACFRVVLPA